MTERLQMEVAAKFVAQVIAQFDLTESHCACGFSTKEDLDFWREQALSAMSAFDEVYAHELGIEPVSEGPESLTWNSINGGDLFTLKRFSKLLPDFIDYDGYGCYASATMVSNVSFSPSEAKKHGLNNHFTHVVWYNR